MTLMAGRNEECSVLGVKIQFRRSAQVKAKAEGQRLELQRKLRASKVPKEQGNT
jgi:tRNA G46 methylase TrmB